MTPGTRVRPISDDDWDGIAALEAATYVSSGLSEGRVALESKARVSPATCFVLEIGPRLAGYLLSLPYPVWRYPALARAEELVFRSPNLHLHDLVISEGLRGAGLAKYLLRHLTAMASSNRYQRISLVAVAGSDTFWSARGYHAHPRVTLPLSYGANAVYMSRALPGPGG